MGGIVTCKRRDEPPPMLSTGPQQPSTAQEQPKEDKQELKLPVLRPNDPNDPKHHRLEFTPRATSDQEMFKFFCPLCMCYLKVVWETSCCRNYTCYECAVTFLQSRKVVVGGDEAVPPGPFTATPCPHCAVDTFGFVEVRPTAQPRKYFDSPSVHRAGCSSTFALEAPSPVQPGDTVEDLHRKMMRFGDFHSRKPSDVPAVPAALRQSQRLNPQVPAAASHQDCPPESPSVDVVASLFTNVNNDIASGAEGGQLVNSPAPGDGNDRNTVAFLTPDRPLVMTNLDSSLVTESSCKQAVMNSPVLMPLTPSPFVNDNEDTALDVTSSTLGLSHAFVDVPHES